MSFNVPYHLDPLSYEKKAFGPFTSRELKYGAIGIVLAAVEGDTHDRAKEARRENLPAGVYMTSKHVDRAQDAEELKKEVPFGGRKLFGTTRSAHGRAEPPDDRKLEQMRQTVSDKLETALETRLGESFKAVNEQLSRVH